MAASLHVAGLSNEDLSLVSRPLLEESESSWVEDIAEWASVLDSYWGGGAAKLVAPSEPEFKAPDRFEDLKPIGQGAMGVVYSAWDKEANEAIAIKVGRSRWRNSGSIKREFRTLAKIRHPNLVVLKELHQFDRRIFFSMEYIRGESFSSNAASQKPKGVAWQSEQLAGLCDDFLQLVEGIGFLHRMAFVHCDIKPSNILVTRSGRVVLLDLGLARPTRRGYGQTRSLGGTSAYMSPEQAAGEPPQFASDWFSFGVVMFESLFGRKPFVGQPLEVLFDKLAGSVKAPAFEESGVPESLSRLCIRLLNPEPAERPSLEDIRRSIKRLANNSSVAIEAHTPEPQFFGRRKEIEILDRSMQDSRGATKPSLVLVEGEPGIGKTLLVHEFLKRWGDASEAIILSGRCYENERIPYKAIDAIVGELANQWRLLDSQAVGTKLISSISAVFKGFSGFLGDPDSSTEESSLPQTAADGINAVLSDFISRGKRIVIFIDDIQWADTDSGQLLCEMIAGLPVLLICSHRPIEHSNQFLDHLTEVFSTNDAQNGLRRIEVKPFSDHEAEQFLDGNFPSLNKRLLGKAIGASAGVPMFLTSLARQLYTMPEGQVEPDTLNWTKDLASQAKRLLEFVCTSGYPVHQSIALEAAQISQDSEAAVSALHSRRLVTLSSTQGETMLSPFHDMIRETVYAKLNTHEKKLAHSSIAAISENKSGVPPDRLAFHFREAGNPRKACRYSILSGDVAVESRAFGEAVRAYNEALNDFVGTDDEERGLKQKLAFSLGGLGRASDAGDMYFELASNKDAKAVQFIQMAAYQYCFAGRIEDSMQKFNCLLQPWGYTTYQSEASALLRLGFLRFKLSILKLKNSFRNWLTIYQLRLKASLGNVPAIPAPRKNSDPAEAIRIAQLCDLLWDVANALSASAFENVQAALFVNYSLQVAIRQKDEVRTLRAEILWAELVSEAGSSKEKSIRERLDMMDTVTIKNNAYLAGTHLKARGFLAMCNGIWDEAARYSTAADEYLRKNCPDSHEEIAAVQLWGVAALQYTGQVKSTLARYQELLASPSNCDHRLNISNLMSSFSSFVCLVRDRPSEALSSIDEAMKMWPVDKIYIQHIRAMFGRAEVFLYTGDYRQANEKTERLWRMFSRSSYRHVQLMRILISELRGRSAVSRFETSDGRAAERIAHRAIKKLEREKVNWAHPMAQRVRANIELKKQNVEAAKAALRAARDGFEQCKMRLYRNTAEAKLCEISGVLESTRYKLVEDWFESQQIKNPQALIGMHFPGASEGRYRQPESRST